MSRIDFATGELLDYWYHQKHYKLIGVDLSREANKSMSQEIDFVENIEEDDGTTIFFISENQQKTILNFYLDWLVITE